MPHEPETATQSVVPENEEDSHPRQFKMTPTVRLAVRVQCGWLVSHKGISAWLKTRVERGIEIQTTIQR